MASAILVGASNNGVFVWAFMGLGLSLGLGLVVELLLKCDHSEQFFMFCTCQYKHLFHKSSYTVSDYLVSGLLDLLQRAS